MITMLKALWVVVMPCHGGHGIHLGSHDGDHLCRRYYQIGSRESSLLNGQLLVATKDTIMIDDHNHYA